MLPSLIHPIPAAEPRPPRRWVKQAGKILFALFPLAYFAGGLLDVQTQRGEGYADFRLETDRSRAIEAARAFLKAQGLDTETWSVRCSGFPESTLYRYYKSKPGPDADLASAIAPPAHVRLLFQSPRGNQQASVRLTFENRILGFDLRNATQEMTGGSIDSAMGEAESMSLSESLLAAEPVAARIMQGVKPEVEGLDKAAGGITRKYTWRKTPPSLPELELSFSLALRNGKLLARSSGARIDPVYVTQHFRPQGSVRDIFTILRLVLLFAVVIYAIASYARRATQKEVSHKRTLYLILWMSLFFVVTTLSGSSQDDLALDPSLGLPGGIGTSIVLLILLAQAILVGISFGASEGDIREAYPGKLTSLDVLVLGRPFSKNVGRSILSGIGSAGWLLLTWTLLQTAVPSLTGTQSFLAVKFPFMHSPYVAFLTSIPALLFVYFVLALLQPLGFATRFFRTTRSRLAVLIPAAALMFTALSEDQASLGGYFVFALVHAAAVLIPFFWFDVLAALTSLIAFSLSDSLIQVAVAFPTWRSFFYFVIGFGIVTSLAQLLAMWRGREWSEEQVRPEYARHIAERQALQEEVAAAREAQLRLLPQEIPQLSGLSIYASCLPAREVGGDFYDFFPLGPRQIGVFIAEGGNRGMASALAIALAKGYLMHTTRGRYTPTQVIERLESTLGSILDNGVVQTTVAYGVIDLAEGTLRYARTGVYPRVIVTAHAQLERELPPLAGAPIRNPIHECAVRLSAGDTIIFYTDGIARRISATTPLPQDEWVRGLALQLPHSAESLHLHLLTSIGAGPEHAHQERDDDLTAIVIRCDQIGTAALEGAA